MVVCILHTVIIMKLLIESPIMCNVVELQTNMWTMHPAQFSDKRRALTRVQSWTTNFQILGYQNIV